MEENLEDSFGVFLSQKGIDSKKFRNLSEMRYHLWEKEFGELGEKSFDLRKKFFWNDLRMTCPLAVSN